MARLGSAAELARSGRDELVPALGLARDPRQGVLKGARPEQEQRGARGHAGAAAGPSAHRDRRVETGPGGGWPDKVDRMIAQVCQERGVARPAYIQVEGTDLEILKLACSSGRIPAIRASGNR